ADPRSLAAIAGALAHDEPQIAIREGRLRAPRLVRATSAGVPRAFDPRGTVLVTGGTGALGVAIAKHLVARHGVRHLLLLSRQGADAPGAIALRDELAARGADASLWACDVTDRAALARCLDAIPAEHPLTAVFHTAAVLDDAPVLDLTPERVARVFAPKLDA